MEYTSEATKNLATVISDGLQGAGKFSVEIQNGDGSPSELGMPPVLEVIRAISSDNVFGIETGERLAKYCLMNKITILKYDGTEIGRVVVNSIDTPWDAYDVLVQYPMALQFIINTCAAGVIKKSIPPRVRPLVPPEAAAGASV